MWFIGIGDDIDDSNANGQVAVITNNTIEDNISAIQDYEEELLSTDTTRREEEAMLLPPLPCPCSGATLGSSSYESLQSCHHDIISSNNLSHLSYYCTRVSKPSIIDDRRRRILRNGIVKGILIVGFTILPFILVIASTLFFQPSERTLSWAQPLHSSSSASKGGTTMKYSTNNHSRQRRRQSSSTMYGIPQQQEIVVGPHVYHLNGTKLSLDSRL